MNAPKSVVSINIAPEEGGPVNAVDQIEAVAGKGLKGDRYFTGDGTFSKKRSNDTQVTLIESEAIIAIRREYDVNIEAGLARRNIVTQGVPLNHFVGREFKVGGAVFRGVKLCEPCGYLEKLTVPGIKNSLVHRGGLRAEIIKSGIIRPGDPIETISGQEI